MAEQSWQPIETAPKTGSFLACWRSKKMRRRIDILDWSESNGALWGGRYNKVVKQINFLLAQITAGSPHDLLQTRTDGHLLGNDFQFLKVCGALCKPEGPDAPRDIFFELYKSLSERPELMHAIFLAMEREHRGHV